MHKKNSARLHADLALRIARLIEAGALEAGDRLTESGLALRLQVSRTPVRAALQLLVDRGVVGNGARGFIVADTACADIRAAVTSLTEPPSIADAERLALAIAADRKSGLLPSDISEAQLMRRYGVRRNVMKRLMGELADLGVAERKPGHGWLFLPGYETARDESYRWRMLVEPAALLEPGYALDIAWVESMRDRHHQFLQNPWRESDAVGFFTMNSAFHEGLCAGAGNRFILQAMKQQSRLRQLSNYNWVFGVERVHQSCRQHLDILDRLQAGDRDQAAALLRLHIEQAMGLTNSTPQLWRLGEAL